MKLPHLLIGGFDMDKAMQNLQEPSGKKAYTTPVLMEHGTVETITGMPGNTVGGSDADLEMEDNGGMTLGERP